MAKDPRKMTPKERREKMIKDRAERSAIKKGGTYDEVPSGRLTSRVQKAKDALDGRKGAKATSGTVLTFKDTGTGAGADPKSLFKPKKKAPKKVPSTKSRDKDGLGVKPKAKAKPNTKPAASGKVSFGTAFANARKAGLKTFTWNGKKYSTQTKAEAAKKKTPAAPKPRPKKKTPTSEGNTVAGVKGTKKAAPKKAPSTKSRDKDGLGVKPKVPAGAKPFKGSYNSKTHKLTKVNGKMYVVPKK